MRRRLSLAFILLLGLLTFGVYPPFISQFADDRSVQKATASTWLVDRIGEIDRYATAAKLSQQFFAAPAEVVFIASGVGFADALAGGAAAGLNEAPLLLTAPDYLPAVTESELKRLQPRRVVLLGGVNAVSAELEVRISEASGVDVERVAGRDRYSTAVELSQRMFPLGAQTVYLVSGNGFADGLASGPWAAATAGPVLLTAAFGLPEVVSAEIERLGATSVVVVGGSQAVSDQTMHALQGPSRHVVRRSGIDRHSTSVAISRESFTAADVAIVVTGGNFPDALAAGSLARRLDGPLLLTRAECLPMAVADELLRLKVSRVVVVGGTTAVTAAAAAGKRCTSGDSPTQRPGPLQSVSPSSIDNCKVPDQRLVRHQPNNVGFPLAGNLSIPSDGTANIIFIPAQFSDAVGEPDPMGEFGPQLQKITEWSERMSGGRFRYEFQKPTDWVTVPVKSADFPVGWVMQNGPQVDLETQIQLAEAIVSAAGNQFDYAGADGIIFHFPSSIKGLERDLGGRGIHLNTPGGRFPYFFWGGGQYHHETTHNSPHYQPLTASIKRSKFWAFWIHEMLHSQGLALHAPGNGFAVGLGQDQYGPSLVIGAWEQFLLGWLTDRQVFCATREDLNESDVILTAVEVQGGERQVAIVRVGASQALVIESRRPVGDSSEWAADARGVFVYRVDTRLDNDRSGESFGDTGNDPTHSKWAYYLAPEGAPDRRLSNNYLDFLLKQGDSVVSDGVRITLENSDEKDHVRIQRVGS